MRQVLPLLHGCIGGAQHAPSAVPQLVPEGGVELGGGVVVGWQIPLRHVVLAVTHAVPTVQQICPVIPQGAAGGGLGLVPPHVPPVALVSWQTVPQQVVPAASQTLPGQQTSPAQRPHILGAGGGLGFGFAGGVVVGTRHTPVASQVVPAAVQCAALASLRQQTWPIAPQMMAGGCGPVDINPPLLAQPASIPITQIQFCARIVQFPASHSKLHPTNALKSILRANW